jgi:hypothetical protein
MGQASLSDTIQRFPWLGKLYTRLYPRWAARLASGSAKHESYTMELVQRLQFPCLTVPRVSGGLDRPVRADIYFRRINNKTPRKDFMSYLLHERSEFDEEISDMQLAAHASNFVYV